MITNFYKKYAHYYDIISNDRDFSGQINLIKSLLGSKKNTKFLELFAGPARHSIACQKYNNIEVFAIDNSPEMKDIAIENGFLNSSNYFIGNLPEGIVNKVKENELDCVLCLRYSIGYLSRKEILDLFTILKQKLSPNGKIIIEVHNIYNIISSMAGTEIRKRKAISKSDETVECLWPNGDINWSYKDYLAKMNVNVKINKGDHTKELNFLSEEHIYSTDAISFIAEITGLKSSIIKDKYPDQNWERYFKNSILIELTK